MRVTILAPGSRGDVQPYVALGRALLGHGATRCTLVTTLDHEALVRSYGLDLVTVPVNVADELRRVEATRSIEGGGVLSSFRQLTSIAKRAARCLAEVGLEACRGADVVVTGFSATLVADGISKKLGVPVVQAFNVPLTTTAELPSALFPWLDLGGLSRRLGHRLTRAALWTSARSAANEACVEVLGARSTTRFPGPYAGLLPGPVLYGFSEALVPRPRDWGDDVHVTGFWFADEPTGFSPPDALTRFLDAGPPPVAIGFGSMVTERRDELGALVLDAAKAAGVRVVLLSGWAGLEPERLSDEVLAVREAPHSWLYPRCRAVVHHGGAGTTAAAVRAGVPAVVVPFHGDQPFWASRVRALGLGPAACSRKRLTARRLADAIGAAVTSDALRERAQEVGRVVRGERGAENAAQAIVARARG